MIDFKSIKENLDLIDTARYYNVHITGNSMINCIFHDDKNPSMKLYHDHFYCFGCGEHGDVIAFNAKLFGLSQYESRITSYNVCYTKLLRFVKFFLITMNCSSK